MDNSGQVMYREDSETLLNLCSKRTEVVLSLCMRTTLQSISNCLVNYVM